MGSHLSASGRRTRTRRSASRSLASIMGTAPVAAGCAMNSFEANVSRLAQRDSALAAALRESGRGTLEIMPARTGVPSARAHGRWIHSAYDPVKEAQVWAEGQRYEEGETLVVFGVGLLYHVEALCARLPRTAGIVLVVPDLNVLVDAAVARTWGDWMDRVSWAWGATEA